MEGFFIFGFLILMLIFGVKGCDESGKYQELKGNIIAKKNFEVNRNIYKCDLKYDHDKDQKELDEKHKRILDE